MRVLHVLRPNGIVQPGGDTVFARAAGDALRAQGVEVDLVATTSPDPRGYDLAHVFGVFEPETAELQLSALRNAGVPLALSPIWVELRSYFAAAPRLSHALGARIPGARKQRLRRLPDSARRAERGGKVARDADRRLAVQRDLMRRADVLLPASEVEAHLYGERLRISDMRYVVVPAIVERSLFDLPRDRPRAGILCVGRVEPKKNQAALLYVARDLDIDVTIVGREYDAPYSALCRRFATKRTRFVATPPRETVLDLMTRTALHVSATWFEAPGLATLEAAAAGANVVAGDRGCEREYLGPSVDYADPSDVMSIRRAVLRALERPRRERDDALEQRIRGFTAERHAAGTLAAYALAMAR